MSTSESPVKEKPENKSPGTKDKDFDLCYAYPVVEIERSLDQILTVYSESPRESSRKNELMEDGFYESDSPFTRDSVKPYPLKRLQMLQYDGRARYAGKMVDLVVRDLIIQSSEKNSTPSVRVVSAHIKCGEKTVCEMSKPIENQLYKLLVKNSEFHKICVRLRAQACEPVIVPLPLPKRIVKNHKLEIQFSVKSTSGMVYPGIMICLVSVRSYGPEENFQRTETYFYSCSNDPNDPRNFLSRPKSTSRRGSQKPVETFTLEPECLKLCEPEDLPKSRKPQRTEEEKLPNVVVAEQSTFSLIDVSFRTLFQPKRPLRPTSSTRRRHVMGKEALTITVLRGIEVPVREESAQVQALVEVEWNGVVHATSVSDGPAPIWNQTFHFELPRQNGEQSVKLRLFDQHPVWGQQWLGEARIPLKYHRNYHELERWITLSPLYSPVLIFGYVQASPGQPCTRLYIVMRIEQPSNGQSFENSAVVKLSKGIQRCLSVPYKINGIDNPESASRLAMLLSHLPDHYGPLSLKQALNLNKADHYSRATLLAALLQGFDIDSHVLIGSSQTSMWSAFVLTVQENEKILLWDPETGENYELGNSRCTLLKVSYLMNHTGAWENLQKSILPHNLKYDTKIGKDWRPIFTSSSSSSRTVQTLDLPLTPDEETKQKELAVQIESHLREKLSEWRAASGLVTAFNRYAVSLVHSFISKAENATKPQLDRKGLKQLYRAYHTHGFVLNLRNSGIDEIARGLLGTKIHCVTGPVEFAVACYVQPFIGKTFSIWIAAIVIRDRD